MASGQARSIDATLLIEEARAAMGEAYAPYSGFRVGAALATGDGSIFRGANVENASLGLSICAERVAACKAVTSGARDFEMLAVVCSGQDQCRPCGACLQFLAEFAPDLAIITPGESGEVATTPLRDLLPSAFRL